MALASALGDCCSANHIALTMAKKAMKTMKAMKSMKANSIPKTMKMMKAMKAMKTEAMKAAKLMPKAAIANALAAACKKKKSEMTKILDALAELASKEIKSTGKFMIPGVCIIKTRNKPAVKATKRMAFGKEIQVKAKPARTVVKAYLVAAIKREAGART